MDKFCCAWSNEGLLGVVKGLRRHRSPTPARPWGAAPIRPAPKSHSRIFAQKAQEGRLPSKRLPMPPRADTGLPGPPRAIYGHFLDKFCCVWGKSGTFGGGEGPSARVRGAGWGERERAGRLRAPRLRRRSAALLQRWRAVRSCATGISGGAKGVPRWEAWGWNCVLPRSIRFARRPTVKVVGRCPSPYQGRCPWTLPGGRPPWTPVGARRNALLSPHPSRVSLARDAVPVSEKRSESKTFPPGKSRERNAHWVQRHAGDHNF